MPAVIVNDLSALPKVPVPDRAVATERPVTSVTTAPAGFEGEGFPVSRRERPGTLTAGSRP